MITKEQGSSLVELLISTAIAGLIVSVLGVATHQIITIADYGNDKMTALHELQNVAHLVSIDGQGASTASGGDGLVLTLPDGSSIAYALEGSELHRTAGGSQMTLARNISALSFSVEGRLVTMTITSSPEGSQNVSQQGTYKIYLRPTGGAE